MSFKIRVNDNEQEFTVLEPDVYDATFTRYEQVDTQFGPGLKLYFNVMNPADGQPVEVSGLCSIPQNGLTPKSKLRGWLQGMLGRNLAGSNEEIDLDRLISTGCRLNLDVIEKSRDDGTKAVFNRITGILPYRRRGQQAAQQSQQQASQPTSAQANNAQRQPVGAAPTGKDDELF